MSSYNDMLRSLVCGLDIAGLVGVFYADVVVHVVIVELMTDAIFRS